MHVPIPVLFIHRLDLVIHGLSSFNIRCNAPEFTRIFDIRIIVHDIQFIRKAVIAELRIVQIACFQQRVQAAVIAFMGKALIVADASANLL